MEALSLSRPQLGPGGGETALAVTKEEPGLRMNNDEVPIDDFDVAKMFDDVASSDISLPPIGANMGFEPDEAYVGGKPNEVLRIAINIATLRSPVGTRFSSPRSLLDPAVGDAAHPQVRSRARDAWPSSGALANAHGNVLS